MATTPSFIGSPIVGQGIVTTANTTLNNSLNSGLPANAVLLVTGATNGTRILEIVTQAQGTAVAGFINVWISTDSGSNYYLFDQITTSAATPSTSVKANRNTATYANLVLKSGHRLAVTTYSTNNIAVHALGGDL